jgi:hypothetical protein
MTPSSGAIELRKRLNAVICPFCTERRDDGSCGLDRLDECPIATHLDALVYAAVTVHSQRLDDYVDAVRRDICPTCRHRTLPADRCDVRSEGHCSLDAYLMPALDVVEQFVQEVAERAKDAPAREGT